MEILSHWAVPVKWGQRRVLDNSEQNNAAEETASRMEIKKCVKQNSIEMKCSGMTVQLYDSLVVARRVTFLTLHSNSLPRALFLLCAQNEPVTCPTEPLL